MIEYSKLDFYSLSRYFKVLVQELDVKMDKGWLLELVALFGSENQALDVSSD